MSEEKVVMKGYKAFNKGMKSKFDKQYAENTVFEEDVAEVRHCGMHFCKNPLDTLDHYPLVNDKGEITEFAEVEALDEVKTDNYKLYCTKKLKIGAKISLAGFIKASLEKTRESIIKEAEENGGEDFRRVLEEICKVKDETVSVPRPPRKWLNAGSIMGDGFSVAWRTYNAEYFGVAQSRKRIYLVADFGGYRAEKIQFKPESVSGNFETMRQSFRDYQSDLAKSFGVTGTRPYDNGNNDDGRSGDTFTGQQDKSSGECLTNPIRENGTRGGKCSLCNEFQGEY